MLSSSVLAHIVERLLRNPVEVAFDLDRQPPFLLDAQVRLHACAPLDRSQARLQRSHQSLGFQHRWVQLENEQAHVAHPLLRGLLQLLQVTGCDILFAGCQCQRCGVGIEGYAVKRLGH